VYSGSPSAGFMCYGIICVGHVHIIVALKH